MSEDKIPIFNSEEFADNVAGKVYNKIAGTFSDFMLNIEQGQRGIAENVASVKKRVEDDELKIKEHGERLDKKKEDIQKLRDDYEKNKEHLEYVAKVKPTLETLQNMFNFWTLKNWWKIAVLVFAILLVFTLMVVGLNFYMHKNGMVTKNAKPKIGMQQIEADIRTGHLDPTTRGSAKIHYTDAQKDSIIKDNQMHAQKSIDERNANYKRLSETWKKQSNE